MNEKTGVDVFYLLDIAAKEFPSLMYVSERFQELLEAAKVLQERFKPIRDDLLFSKRIALERLDAAISNCTAPATPKET